MAAAREVEAAVVAVAAVAAVADQRMRGFLFF
jgi:hypothetical protein